MTTNRLIPEEAKVLEKARQLFRHRTSQNHNHLMAAIGEWVRAEKVEECPLERIAGAK